MKPIILLSTILTVSSLGFAEGLRSFISESMYCNYTQGACSSIESGKIEATRKANAICAPEYAAQMSGWTDFEKNISPFRPTSWIKATFACSESRSEDVTCMKLGTSYIVRCCDTSGSCWIE